MSGPVGCGRPAIPPPIVAVRTAGLHEKEALLAAGFPGIFTIPHFEGYAAVPVELRAIRKVDGASSAP